MLKPRIIIALDTFKGALTADVACKAVAAGLRRADPAVACILKPMADGGEGTVAALLASRPEAEWVSVTVAGPLREKSVAAGFGWIPGVSLAMVEMAMASGLPLLGEQERNPMRTSTYGTGQVLDAAIRHGASHILLAIGGSATVDGGTGAAAALGWRFLDKHGSDVPPAGGMLVRIARIVPPPYPRLPRVQVLCDVTNPLCGSRGAAAVFGPQKGATPDMVGKLEAGLANLADRIQADLGKDVRDLPGAGAAGGLGAGAVAFLDAELVPGIERIIAVAQLQEALQGADWCVTGEGCFDTQSLDGKVVSGVARAARAAGVPVVVLAGQVRVETNTYREHGIREACALQAPGMTVAESMQRTEQRLQEVSAEWWRGKQHQEREKKQKTMIEK